jgi:hypothetical protein
MTATLSNQPYGLSAVAPARPTPVSDIVTVLRSVEGLQDLADDEYYWLASHGSERIAADRAVVFREDEPAHHLNIILKGNLRSSKKFGLGIVVHRPNGPGHWQATLFADDGLGRRR